jgi:hypothetical protein
LAEAKRGCPPANPSLVAGERREDGGASCAPHSEQNFAEAGLPWPHAGQARGSGAPHSEQNFAASGTLALQLGQFIDASRTTAGPYRLQHQRAYLKRPPGPNFTAQLRGSPGLRA